MNIYVKKPYQSGKNIPLADMMLKLRFYLQPSKFTNVFCRQTKANLMTQGQDGQLYGATWLW